MYDSALPCSPSAPIASSSLSIPAFMRDESELRATFASRGARTGIERHYERGSMRLRLPRSGERCEAILLNTGGGLAGGDQATLAFEIGNNAAVTVTNQAAEKVYRAEQAPTSVRIRITMRPDARLVWLPQETILHDGARLVRSLDVDIDSGATLTLMEIIVFGRLAHGEQMHSGMLHDRWRVRRAGRLAFAEDVRLSGAIAATLDRPALGAGARAVATFLHIAPDAEQRLAAARRSLETAACFAACSAWHGMLVARFAGADPTAVRSAASALAQSITAAPVPRSWSC